MGSAPSKHKTCVHHLYNAGTTSSNIVQILYKCFVFTVMPPRHIHLTLVQCWSSVGRKNMCSHLWKRGVVCFHLTWTSKHLRRQCMHGYVNDKGIPGRVVDLDILTVSAWEKWNYPIPWLNGYKIKGTALECRKLKKVHLGLYHRRSILSFSTFHLKEICTR